MSAINDKIDDQKESKKEGFGRKHLNLVRDAKSNFYLSRDQAKKDMAFTQSAGSEFMRRLKYMFVTKRQNLKKEDLKDFESLLLYWGISEGDLPKVKKNMRASIYAVFLMMMVATLGLLKATDLYFYCLLSALIFGGLLRIVMTFWQLWVLRKGRYVSFKDWFTLNF